MNAIGMETMEREKQEADITAWANGVAEELDRKERPELAAVFRALARRDESAVRAAVEVYTPAMLVALGEMLELERRDREAAEEERSVEILDWLEALIDRIGLERGEVDLGPGSAGPVQ